MTNLATCLAHTTIKGEGDFVTGFVHPVTTPSHLFILLGLSLLLAQRSPLSLKLPILVFAPVSLLALLVTMTGIITAVYQPLLIGLALCIAAIVALDLRLSLPASSPLFAAAALAIGFDSAVEGGAFGKILVTLLGTWLCLLLVLIDLSYYVSLGMKRKWMQIGVRVLASWIIAIALLVLAFSLRR